MQNGEINERFLQIKAHYFSNSNRQFAQAIGVQENSLSSICSGKKKPGKQILQKVMDACPDLSRAWLVLGEGQMLVGCVDISSSQITESNVIGSMGDNNGNIGTLGIEKICEQYEARLRDKDELIAELRARIEDQRKYISLLSEEHRSLVHQALEIVGDTNTKVTTLQESADVIRQIGFDLKESR